MPKRYLRRHQVSAAKTPFGCQHRKRRQGECHVAAYTRSRHFVYFFATILPHVSASRALPGAFQSPQNLSKILLASTPSAAKVVFVQKSSKFFSVKKCKTLFGAQMVPRIVLLLLFLLFCKCACSGKGTTKGPHGRPKARQQQITCRNVPSPSPSFSWCFSALPSSLCSFVHLLLLPLSSPPLTCRHKEACLATLLPPQLLLPAPRLPQAVLPTPVATKKTHAHHRPHMLWATHV